MQPPTFGGESPFECAVRETAEETGLQLAQADLHLFAMIAEKAYHGDTHWLMFLFRCRRPIVGLPPEISEGRFGFFSREQIKSLPIPETDKAALWPIFDRYREGFVALRADCTQSRSSSSRSVDPGYNANSALRSLSKNARRRLGDNSTIPADPCSHNSAMSRSRSSASTDRFPWRPPIWSGSAKRNSNSTNSPHAQRHHRRH